VGLAGITEAVTGARTPVDPPPETMATNATRDPDKGPTDEDESDDNQSCRYQPRQYVDERLLETGRYDY